MPPASLLFLASAPAGQARLHTDYEHRAIAQSLATGPLALHSAWAVHAYDLQPLLLARRADIVHISTHGQPGGALLFIDDHGNQRIPPESLAGLFAALSHRPRLVVLSACHSAPAARALCAHVPCAIGLDGAVPDHAAIAFSAALYRALALGCSVARSVQLARSELALYSMPAADKLALYTHPDVDANQLCIAASQRFTTASQRSIIASRPGASLPPMLGVPECLARPVGRAADMAALEQAIAAHHVAISGLPGMGKSELAARLCERLARTGQYPGGILWLSARHRDLTAAWGQSVADQLGLPPGPLAERAHMAVRQVADAGRPTLIVLDDARAWGPGDKPGPLPRGPDIRLLITTRQQGLGGDRFQQHPLAPLTSDEARQLLTQASGRTLTGADSLLDYLAGHPLALTLAGAFLADHPGRTPAGYLAELGHLADTMHDGTAELAAHEHTVYAAFASLWKRLDDDAQDAWLMAACLASDGAGLSLCGYLGLSGPVRRALARVHLCADGGHQPSATSRFRLHALARDMGKKLGTRARRTAARRRFVASCESFAHALDPALDTPAGLSLYIAERGNLDRALARAERLYRPDAPILASLRAHIGRALHCAGQLARSHDMLNQALAVEASGGAPVLQVAELRARVGQVCLDLGRPERAVTLIRDALNHERRVLGAGAARVVERRAQLADALLARGRPDEARALLEGCLRDSARYHGQGHLLVARLRAQLAAVLRHLGQLGEARALFAEALAVEETQLSALHPQVIVHQSEFGALLTDMGQPDRAVALLEGALASVRRALGPVHPLFATVASELAMAHCAGRAHERAQELLEQALTTGEHALGSDHPLVALWRANLALVLEARGDELRARKLLAEVVRAPMAPVSQPVSQPIRQTTGRGANVYGATCATATGATVIGAGSSLFYNARKQYSRSLALWQQALAAVAERLGPGHPRLHALNRHLEQFTRRFDEATTACA